MKTTFFRLGVLLICLSCVCWIFSSEGMAYASEKARARDMTPEELKNFEPGFGCETHCEPAGTNCDEVGPCCFLSIELDCENQPPKEKCGSSDCGFWWDPCDTECVQDPDADCGRKMEFACGRAPCAGGFGTFGGAKTFQGYQGDCVDVFQCHTGSI